MYVYQVESELLSLCVTAFFSLSNQINPLYWPEMNGTNSLRRWY